MPQLDTSHWFVTILTMMITLFLIFQYKISKFTILFYPYKKMLDSTKHKNPWELKWTKIYLPHFQPQH